jgi:hypothetical protein
VVCRDEECERRDEHLDGELSTGMREDIFGQAPRGLPEYVLKHREFE